MAKVKILDKKAKEDDPNRVLIREAVDARAIIKSDKEDRYEIVDEADARVVIDPDSRLKRAARDAADAAIGEVLTRIDALEEQIADLKIAVELLDGAEGETTDKPEEGGGKKGGKK